MARLGPLAVVVIFLAFSLCAEPRAAVALYMAGLAAFCLVNPVRIKVLNVALDPRYRVTALSFASIAVSLLSAVSQPLFGWLSGLLDMRLAMVGAARDVDGPPRRRQPCVLPDRPAAGGGTLMNLELYRPAVEDLWFKRDLLGDEATMSYNRAWGGTVDFPEHLWPRWARRLGRARGGGAALLPLPARRGYRRVRGPRSPIAGTRATTASLRTCSCTRASRGRGYGGVGLELLCGAARGRGIATLRDNVALDNPAIASSCATAFTKEWRSDEFVMLRRDL